MERRKRAHVPKIRGCYECSQRRIHCDLNRPACKKCLGKGIVCSGFGVRVRFHSDTTARRKDTRDAFANPIPCHGVPARRSTTGTLDNSQKLLRGLNDEAVAGIGDRITLEDWSPSSWDLFDSIYGDQAEVQTSSEDSEDVGRAEEIEMLISPSSTLPPDLQYLFLHFSDRIASNMVVIDDNHNGWRFFILPIALEQDLLQQAVISASAFHHSANVGHQLLDADQAYAKAIHQLREQQDLDGHDMMGKQTILLTLLVLLAVVMINGSSDFPIVMQLLESAVEAIGGEETLTGHDLGLFIVRQVRKFRGYAAPFLSEEGGLARLQRTISEGWEAHNGWDDFRSYYSLYPILSAPMDMVYDLNKQACELYVKRALLGPSEAPLVDLVNRYKSTLQSLPRDHLVEHNGTGRNNIMVNKDVAWGTVIAAAESTSPEDQQYFSEVLMDHYRHNGFANLLVAMKHLETIWAQRTMRNWTKLLAEIRVLIV